MDKALISDWWCLLRDESLDPPPSHGWCCWVHRWGVFCSYGFFFWFGAWIGAVWVEDWGWLAFGLGWVGYFSSCMYLFVALSR